MASPYILEFNSGGFSFENCIRNARIQASGEQSSKLKAKKTGTTIAGLIFKDGVVLGADTRATSGETVADKNCSKIHYITPNIYCCGAGTAADTEKTTDMLRSNLALQILAMGRNPRLIMACRILQDFLFRHKGQISAMLLLGGVDCTGPHIFTVGPYGSVNKAPFATMGSGDLAALAVFEDRYKPNMTEEEAKLLVRDAIHAGIMNDLGSGSNVDLCVIRRNGAEYIRPFESSNYKSERQRRYKYPEGTTPVLKEQTMKLDLVEETVHQMEVAQ
ncbi:proteasome 20S subunit beta 13a [Triplophysa rosa]|uniref:Proteasome subunit beta n=1 Tax=Triplophysa rosa TaxID=992332 RepID=A0A9W7TI34_TRIRA|nr:proteasome 20S subunit beta 13a [Triplophysa rosa]KAI7799180.1 putative proteasome subunit beta type-7-like [Triplophysa rosa]